MEWVSGIIAITVPGVLVVGYLNRRGKSGDEMRGMGWKFLRFTVIGIAIPITGVLALNNALTGEAAAIIAGAMGYAFGHSAKDG